MYFLPDDLLRPLWDNHPGPIVGNESDLSTHKEIAEGVLLCRLNADLLKSSKKFLEFMIINALPIDGNTAV